MTKRKPKRSRSKNPVHGPILVYWCKEIFVTQTRNNYTHLYAFIHNYIYCLLHTTIIRHTSERTGEKKSMNSNEHVKQSLKSHTTFEQCDQVLNFRAYDLTFPRQ